MPKTPLSHSSKPGPPRERIDILFIIPSFKTGGAEIQLLSLVRGLSNSLFNVTIAAFYRGNELDRFFENCPHVTVVFLNKKGALDFTFVRRLLALYRHQRYDIVQCYNVSARLFGMITAKRVHVGAIVMTERTARLLYSSFGSRIYLFFEKYAIRSADILVANSEAGRRFAISRGVRRERTRVIYNGVDPERFIVTRHRDLLRDELSIPKDAFVVGMIARIDSLKDPFTFLHAARDVLQEYEKIRFLLVGDGPLLQSLKERAVEMGLKNRMIFTGFRTDVANLLNCLDVVTLTSNQVEGCSNSLLEAMALGKPVIATRVGGNLELIENEKTGLLVAPSDPEKVAQAVVRLYHDKRLLNILAKNARRLVESTFSQRSMVSQHEKLYLELVSNRPLEQENCENQTGARERNMSSPFPRSSVLGYPVDQMTLQDCIHHFDMVIREKRHCHIVVINAAKVVKAQTDAELNSVIHTADLVGADGVPIVWASRLLDRPLPDRVNGTDLMQKIFKESARKGWRIFLLGARQHVIESVVKKLKTEMPSIQIAGFRNGYFDSIEEERSVVDLINASRADILLLGFGTPMKEKWVKRHQERLRIPVIHGVGGSFDIVGGLTKRAPKWMQKYGLEWLYRLVQEPGRMWKRYLVTNWLFTWLVFKAWLRQVFARPDVHSEA